MTIRSSVAVFALAAAMLAAGCNEEMRVGGVKVPLVYQNDFETTGMQGFKPTDVDAWRIDEIDGNRVLSQHKRRSDYEPEVRSPFNYSIIEDVTVGSFVLEVKMHSTVADYGHRDMCLFFGHQDPSHFYYVHIANQADPHANSIFIVNGEPRVSIARTRTDGTKWDENWHTARIVRDVKTGSIEVYFDDRPEPIMTAVDDTFKWGRIGVGTFDDTGQFDDIRIWGEPVDR